MRNGSNSLYHLLVISRPVRSVRSSSAEKDHAAASKRGALRHFGESSNTYPAPFGPKRHLTEGAFEEVLRDALSERGQRV